MAHTIRKRNFDTEFHPAKELRKKSKQKVDLRAINSIIEDDLQDSYEELFDIESSMKHTKKHEKYI